MVVSVFFCLAQNKRSLEYKVSLFLPTPPVFLSLIVVRELLVSALNRLVPGFIFDTLPLLVPIYMYLLSVPCSLVLSITRSGTLEWVPFSLLKVQGDPVGI